MSTFGGIIEEIPGISVDRFDEANYNSTIYFLSHCHTDHMQGLDNQRFQNSLVYRPNVFLYASPISVHILKNRHPEIESKLKELPLNSSTLIKFPYRDDKCLTVTPMPAGHCPGSVMFLFETDKTILYTGDYRVNASDLKKYSAFYSLGQLKKIDKMYLDTTFFKLSFSKLPSRQNCLEQISKIIKEWIEQSKKHIIKIHPSAKYGSEFLFAEIAKALNMPIHVNKDAYRFYKSIPEMDQAVTTNHKLTQIHAGCGSHFKAICEIEKNNHLTRIIKPSVLWWGRQDIDNGSFAVTGKGDYRVCYSCHASLEEIEEFLLFLKPAEIEPCVVPHNCKEKEEMLALLQQVMKMYKEQPVQEETMVIKLFKETTGVSEDAASAAGGTTQSTPDKRDNDVFDDDLLCSPPKDFKRRRLWLKENKNDEVSSS